MAAVYKQDHDYLFKLLLIGDAGVGKSKLLMRFADDQYSDASIPTIGVDFKLRTVQLDSKVAKLQIWDTAGQERFRTITSSYYRGAHGIIMVYDVTRSETFETLPHWFTEVERYGCGNVQMLIVGNKSDLAARGQRQVEFEAAKEFAERSSVTFFETSAKEATNVEDMFMCLVHEIRGTLGLETNVTGSSRTCGQMIRPGGTTIAVTPGKCC